MSRDFDVKWDLSHVFLVGECVHRDRQDYVPKHLKSRNAGDALLGGEDRARNATLVVNKRSRVGSTAVKCQLLI
jgi:hypothetical protein